MSFNPYNIDLPVTEIISDVQHQLQENQTLIISAPPGAGKSTLLPLTLMNEPWLKGKKILMLEPRRLAAKTIAERMSALLNDSLGNTVGYRIRFETRVSDQTKIEVLTEGILTRMIHGDKTLEDVGMVIFDEFHERNIHADVAMALCREVQQVYRPDLKIVVMSATLNIPQLKEKFKAPVVESKGRQYPVDVIYTGGQDEVVLPELTARTVHKAIKEKQGDVLVFLPGEGEIRKCMDLLKKELKGFAILPLYGQLPPGKQYAAIMPDKQGRRKVVLATSIAESSLTIEGVSVVVDTGYGRTQKFDPMSGLSGLQTIKISKDSADQRAGRAGRLGPGTCYRMWNEADHYRLAEHRTPEILEADLCALMLDLSHWGIIDPNQLTWVTPPPKSAVITARETLEHLSAIEDGKITAHGKAVHQLPCHPRIGHMLLMAQQADSLSLATDIAALLEEKDPLSRVREAGVDINARIDVLRKYRKEQGKGRLLGRVERIAHSYRKMFNIEADNEAHDPYETGVLLAYAYPERIACARPGNNSQFQLANGKYASFSHKDDLAYEPWLVIANLNAREDTGKVFLASPLNPKDLAPLVKQKEVVKWDPEDGELSATLDLSIGNIVLKSQPLPAPDEEHSKVRAISDAIRKEGKSLLAFNEKVIQWQNRVLSLRKWRPQEGWPDVSTHALLLTNYDWLGKYLKSINTPDELKALKLLDILSVFLDDEQKRLLDELAPTTITASSGTVVMLTYNPEGAPPYVKTAEEDVPKNEELFINEGKTLVRIV
ncbi:ATP-dependent helicase HrpB [Cytophagaceae bacterium ABcell3]|nr:ATP-dependent helicase HrpB [Cytophagaceae bacterium ABcell3]